MKGYYKDKILRIALLIVCIFAVSSCFAYANSSWIWLTDNRPWDILPWVAAATIIIEALAIWWFPKTGHFVRVLITAVLANLASFLIPVYVWYGSDRAMYDTFQDYLDKMPYFVDFGIEGFMGFLGFTLLIEIPMVVLSLFFITEKRKTLVLTVIGANIVTTALVAVVERLYADGIWAA